MKDIMELAHEALVNTDSKEKAKIYFAEKFREELNKLTCIEMGSAITYKLDAITLKHIITFEFPIDL